MALRYVLLAALVASAFSAQASPLNSEPAGNVTAPFASAGGSTVLLATVSVGQQQTYMPHAVEHFFVFVAAPVADAAPVMLALVGQSPAPAAPVASMVPAAIIAIAAPQLVAAPVAAAPLAELAQQPGGVEVKSDVLDELIAPAGNADLALVDAPLQLLPLALDATAIPEPGSAALMLAGLAGAGFTSRRRRSR